MKRHPNNPVVTSKLNLKSIVAENSSALKQTSMQLKSNQLAQSLSLEDLYLGDDPIGDPSKMSPNTVKREFRRTLRELKEKEFTIVKLREACHDLSVKFADAENTIDQLRFGKKISSNMKASSSQEIHPKNNYQEEMVDVVSQTCSSWLEKVQNWKTAGENGDICNPSASGDSGFRGSDLYPDTPEIIRAQNQKFVALTHHSCSSPPPSVTETSTQTSPTKPVISHSNIHRSRSQSNVDIASIPITSELRKRIHDIHFQRLTPLLDDTTNVAKRTQMKTKCLLKLIRSTDRKI